MEKVTMIKATRWDKPLSVGDEIDVPDKVAQRWESNGIAQIIPGNNDNEEKKEKEPETPEIKITEQNAEPAIKLIEKTEDIEVIMSWLADESQGKNRKTVIEALESRMKELEGGE